MLGIRDNVEDIASSFKKMAVVNTGRHKPKTKPAPDIPERTEAPRTVPSALPQRRVSSATAAQLAALLEQQKVKKPKKYSIDENQISIFDFVA